MLDFCVLYSVFNVHFNSILNTRQSEAIVVLSQPSFRTVSPRIILSIPRFHHFTRSLPYFAIVTASVHLRLYILVLPYIFRPFICKKRECPESCFSEHSLFFYSKCTGCQLMMEHLMIPYDYSCAKGTHGQRFAIS